MAQWRHPVLNFMFRFRQQWPTPRTSIFFFDAPLIFLRPPAINNDRSPIWDILINCYLFLVSNTITILKICFLRFNQVQVWVRQKWNQSVT